MKNSSESNDHIDFWSYERTRAIDKRTYDLIMMDKFEQEFVQGFVQGAKHGSNYVLENEILCKYQVDAKEWLLSLRGTQCYQVTQLIFSCDTFEELQKRCADVNNL